METFAAAIPRWAIAGRQRSSAGAWLVSGWLRALIGSLIAFAIGLVVAQAAAFGFAFAGGSPGSLPSVARAGGLLFYAFHRVPLVFAATLRSIGGARSGDVVVTLAAAPMLGTVIAGMALFAVGRALATRSAHGAAAPAAGSPWAAGAEGAKVAVPYVILCGLAIPLAHLTVNPPSTARALLVGTFSVAPSAARAVVWPFALAAVAGFAGGATAKGASPSARTHRASEATSPIGPMRPRGLVACAIGGGGTMAVLAVVLSFVGLLVLAVVDDRSTHAYFHAALGHGPGRGAAALGLTLLAVPNMATWVLSPSMGSCVGVVHAGGALGGVTAGTCLLSYGRFPAAGLLSGLTGGSAGGLGGHAPTASPAPGYALFVLVPLIAVLAGGWLASSRSGAIGVAESAATGAVAGIVFAVWCFVLVLLSRVEVGVAGTGAASVGGAQTFGAGPQIAGSAGLALAWGVAGGAAGAALHWLVVGRRKEPTRERVFPSGSTRPDAAPAALSEPHV